MFSAFFIEKITKILDSIPPRRGILDLSPPYAISDSAVFQQVSAQDIVIKNYASKSCDLDPVPASLVKMALPQLCPLITSIVNKSLGIPII